ncbi:MAG: DNA alkylation repair protein [Prevotella sp.]|nr:DNA alkylation repair protein [Prevotella sp.]
MMDGSVAQSMRDKGLNYNINWGATLPRLREKAEELKVLFNNRNTDTNSIPSIDCSQYDFALALWKENVRECKILATMLMPPNEILPEVIDIWMEQTESLEIAEQAAMNLYRFLPYAPDKAYQWIASDRELYQLCGFHVLSRLFMNGQEPNERGINEFVDQALAAIQGPSIVVRKAAYNALQRFAELGLVYERIAQSAIKRANLDFL